MASYLLQTKTQTHYQKKRRKVPATSSMQLITEKQWGIPQGWKEWSGPPKLQTPTRKPHIIPPLIFCLNYYGDFFV